MQEIEDREKESLLHPGNHKNRGQRTLNLPHVELWNLLSQDVVRAINLDALKRKCDNVVEDKAMNDY